MTCFFVSEGAWYRRFLGEKKKERNFITLSQRWDERVFELLQRQAISSREVSEDLSLVHGWNIYINSGTLKHQVKCFHFYLKFIIHAVVVVFLISLYTLKCKPHPPFFFSLQSTNLAAKKAKTHSFLFWWYGYHHFFGYDSLNSVYSTLKFRDGLTFCTGHTSSFLTPHYQLDVT